MMTMMKTTCKYMLYWLCFPISLYTLHNRYNISSSTSIPIKKIKKIIVDVDVSVIGYIGDMYIKIMNIRF